MRHRLDDIQQVRKIRPTRRSVSGHFVFRDVGSIPYESTLERDFLARTTFFSGVLDITAQPCEIPFVDPDTGRSYLYTPDFLVTYRLGDFYHGNYPAPELVEVKPEAEWREHWRKWLPKWKAARRWAADRGMRFRIYDEHRIRDEIFTNIESLARYKHFAASAQDIRLLCDLIGHLQVVSIKDLITLHKSQGCIPNPIPLAWHLLVNRIIDCDISRPLNVDTEVWISESTYD